MSDIITFSDPKFTQIKYESGERILLSNADSGIAIFEIIFFGLMRRRTIFKWAPLMMPLFVSKFSIQMNHEHSQFRQVVDKLLTFRNIAELEEFLSTKK